MYHITVVDLDSNTVELDADALSIVGGCVGLASTDETKKPLSEAIFECVEFVYQCGNSVLNHSAATQAVNAAYNAEDYKEHYDHE